MQVEGDLWLAAAGIVSAAARCLHPALGVIVRAKLADALLVYPVQNNARENPGVESGVLGGPTSSSGPGVPTSPSGPGMLGGPGGPGGPEAAKGGSVGEVEYAPVNVEEVALMEDAILSAILPAQCTRAVLGPH